jgi:hypothetical protein
VGSERSVTGLALDGEVVTLAVSDKVFGAGDLRTTATIAPSAPPRRRSRSCTRPHYRPDSPQQRGAHGAVLAEQNAEWTQAHLHGPRALRQNPPPSDRVRKRRSQPPHRTHRIARKRITECDAPAWSSD